VTREEFLDVFPSFRHGPVEITDSLINGGELRRFGRNESLYTPGDACSGIGLFMSGEVRVFRIGEGGREITLYEVLPGETCILNVACILAGDRYPAHAVTVLDGEVLMVPDTLFRALMDEHEEMRNFVFNLFSRRLASVMELVEEIAFGKLDRRLEDYLIEKSDGNRLDITHQQIANDLGTSREVISRILKDMERRGKVRLARHMIVLTGLVPE